MNYGCLVIGFLAGYFFHQKKETLITFFRSLKYLYLNSKDKQIYNDFFEETFSESDYSKERDDIENV